MYETCMHRNMRIVLGNQTVDEWAEFGNDVEKMAIVRAVVEFDLK